MRVAVLTVQVPFVRGGAEILADNLLTALRQAGHEAEIVSMPFKWYPAETLLDSMLAARLLDVSEFNGMPVDLAIGLKFPAYAMAHPRKVLWLLHQHRQAYDLWGHPQFGDINHFPEGRQVRDAIRRADAACMAEAKAVFTISQNVTQRLRHFSGVESTALHHPPADADRLRCEEYGDFLFYPSRINPIKRQELVLRALAHCGPDVRVVFAGASDNHDYLIELKQLAASLGISDRVEWRGRVSDDEKRALYANCRAVVFPPIDEDYGYVTLEAMLSAKAVITTTDAGGPLEFVEDGVNGLVAAPNVASLAEQMAVVAGSPATARKLGEAGRSIYDARGISWDSVVAALVGA